MTFKSDDSPVSQILLFGRRESKPPAVNLFVVLSELWWGPSQRARGGGQFDGNPYVLDEAELGMRDFAHHLPRGRLLAAKGHAHGVDRAAGDLRLLQDAEPVLDRMNRKDLLKLTYVGIHPGSYSRSSYLLL